MPRRIQPTYTKARRHTIAAMGDSVTHNTIYGVPLYNFWPGKLAGLLRDNGRSVRARNFAISGNTTTQMLARVSEMAIYDTPDIAIIFGGINDPGSSITSATTTANIRAIIRYLKNGAAGVVTNPSNLPSGNVEGARYIVTSDNSSSGGVLPDLSGAQTGVQVWEARNGLAGESGWGRVNDLAAADRPTNRFVVVGPHFYNFTAGADTVGVSGSHSGQNATNAAVHTAVSAAATAEGAALCDVYAYMQDRIIDGYDTAASASWHVANTNLHLNAYGESLVAGAVLETITAQSGWLEALS